MYDDLLGNKKKTPEKKERVVAPTPKSAKWSIEDYEQQAYCYQCSSTSITMLQDKIVGGSGKSKGNLVKKVQCNTCFAEWTEVWNENSELVSIGFKF